MNEIHSRYESKYKSRWIVPVVREAVDDYPIVVLTGARQVGKSTFLQHEPPCADWLYVSFDDFDALHRAKNSAPHQIRLLPADIPSEASFCIVCRNFVDILCKKWYFSHTH